MLGEGPVACISLLLIGRDVCLALLTIVITRILVDHVLGRGLFQAVW